MSALHRRSSRPATLVLIPALAGAAVSVALGAYGAVHSPTGRAISTFGFSGLLNAKAWLTTGAAVLAVFQLASALRLYGRIGTGSAPRWLGPAHRASGALAVLLTLPVAYHCLWAFGFSSFDTRTLAHSLLGCLFYGAFVAKMLVLRLHGLPGWALPLAGGLVFSTLTALWLTSSLWFFTTVGFPAF
jgi:Family of unknown function (DUF6529)